MGLGTAGTGINQRADLCAVLVHHTPVTDVVTISASMILEIPLDRRLETTETVLR